MARTALPAEVRPRNVIGAYEDLGMQVVGTGYEFGHADDYQRTFAQVKDGTVICDDVTAHEMEELVRHLQPDLVGSGIKEGYGYEGFPIFARDMTWRSTPRPGGSRRTRSLRRPSPLRPGSPRQTPPAFA